MSIAQLHVMETCVFACRNSRLALTVHVDATTQSDNRLLVEDCFDDSVYDLAAVHADADVVADFELMVWLFLWHYVHSST
jgi:hypothetical protein